MEQVPPVGDDDIILVLKHGVGKKLRRANILTAERANRPKDVDKQKTRTMVIGVGDTKLLAEVPETVVNATVGHADIVRAHSRFVQHVGAEVVRPIDHAIFQARLVEGIEKQSKRINYGVILRALRYPTVYPVVWRDFVVDPHISLVCIVVTSSGVDEVVHQIAIQRQRVKTRRKQVSDHRIDHAQGNLIVRKGCPVTVRIQLKWVVQLDALRCQQLREVALPFGCGEKREGAARRRVIETLSLIVDEKEQFVLHDGATKRRAKHIPAECGLRETQKIVGPVVGVKQIIAEELEDVAVIAVGAGLDGSTDDAPLEISELVGRVLGNQAKFLRLHSD